jgi:hypothetical protein
MTTPMTKFDWDIARHQQVLAGRLADGIVKRLGLTAAIDPLKVAESESRRLVAGGGDFGNGFDWKLKYRRDKQKFVLLYNSKYDVGLPPGDHHPRTRFSIAHELGHFFIEAHHYYLRHGGRPHPSRSEFRRGDKRIEREADAFAASLLLPTHLVLPEVNRAELSPQLLDQLSARYKTSLVCTTIRAVELSGDPCAVAGIREGRIAWMFPSERLIEGKCFPRRGELKSIHATRRWRAFQAGDDSRAHEDGLAENWFQMFGLAANLGDLHVTEDYFPIRLMDTLVVVLTLDDDDLFSGRWGRNRYDDDDDEVWTNPSRPNCHR